MGLSLSRRSFIKLSAAVAATTATAAMPLSVLASAQKTRGIQGYKAPELAVSHWIDGEGKAREPFSVVAHKGKWLYLKCFQEWCPACHSIGFPNLQKLVTAFPNNDVIVPAVIQTTFEGFSTNTVDALRKNQLRYDLNLPFGHDPGDGNLPHGSHNRYPKTMAAYRTGGTPWVILINPQGVVVFNDFHINIDNLINYLNTEAA